MEISKEVPRVTKNRTLDPVTPLLPGFITKAITVSIKQQSYLHTHIYHSTTYNSQVLELT